MNGQDAGHSHGRYNGDGKWVGQKTLQFITGVRERDGYTAPPVGVWASLEYGLENVMSDGIENAYFYEDIYVGQSASFSKTITEADIVLFSGVSGDFNPVHVNEEYAKTTMFKARIAHGMISGALISSVLGMKLPGPGCIYVSQSMKFKAPVFIGDTVKAQVEVISLVPERKFVTFKTTCWVHKKLVVDGEATLLVPTKS